MWYGLSLVKLFRLSSKICKTICMFPLPNFESKLQNPAHFFLKLFEETWKTSQHQTKYRHGKFNINHLNLSNSIWKYIFSYETFLFFNQGTLMMCLSSETAISIEIHIICIMYWFWNKYRNVVEPLSQSRVSLNIVKKVRTSTRISTAIFQW